MKMVHNVYLLIFFLKFISPIIYLTGWLFKLELSSPEEITNLMNEEQYTEFIKQDHS